MATAVLFGFPGHGHVIPSLPTVSELVRRGDRVIYFATPEFQPAVEQTGATFQSYGTAFPLAAPSTLARFSHDLRSAIRVQLETSEWVLDHLLPQIQNLQPDYVIYDSLCAWGWYVSPVLGKPSVSLYPTLVYNPNQRSAEPLSLRMRHLVRDVLDQPAWSHANRLSRRFPVRLPVRLTQLMHSQGTLNLIFTSREFQPGADALDPARFKFIGPAVTPRGDAPAFPFEQLDGRPLILISLGTAFQPHTAFYQACFDALRESPWQIVMAVGAQTTFAPEIIPANFIVRPMVPQLKLLQRTAVFITHGGMNSVNEALYYDVPLVMVPQGADHAWIANRVQELGAGILLNKQRVNAQALRGSVETILRNPAYGKAARRVGASLRATGGPIEAVNEILALAKPRRG